MKYSDDCRWWATMVFWAACFSTGMAFVHPVMIVPAVMLAYAAGQRAADASWAKWLDRKETR